MSEANQLAKKNYPIYKKNFSERCIELKNNGEACALSDIKIEIVDVKSLHESYILQYNCSSEAEVTNVLTMQMATQCYTVKYPLDGFSIERTGIPTLSNSDGEEELLPAADICHIINPETKTYFNSDCGKMLHVFSYFDDENGYKLIAITDENREQIYAEFAEKGYRYEASQAAMNNVFHSLAEELLPNMPEVARKALAKPELLVKLHKLKNSDNLDMEQFVNQLDPDINRKIKAIQTLLVETVVVEKTIKANEPQTWCEYFKDNIFDICDWWPY